MFDKKVSVCYLPLSPGSSLLSFCLQQHLLHEKENGDVSLSRLLLKCEGRVKEVQHKLLSLVGSQIRAAVGDSALVKSKRRSCVSVSKVCEICLMFTVIFLLVILLPRPA